MYLRQRCSQYSRRFDRPRPSRRLLAASLATTVLVLGLVAAAPGFSSPSAARSASCADAVTRAPAAPATVSAASSQFGRILVVKMGDLGDLILTTPALRALRVAQPGATIDLLSPAAAAPVVRGSDLVDAHLRLPRDTLEASAAILALSSPAVEVQGNPSHAPTRT